MRPLPGGATIRLAGDTMGTSWSLEAVAPPSLDPERAGAALERVFGRVIAQMSQWEPDSQLSRFNRAPAGSRIAIGAQFGIVLDCALQVARASGGAFDPALGTATEAWGFGVAPAPDAVPDGGGNGGSRWWALDWSAGAAELVQPGGLALDLSGIAKGFAVDMGIAALQRIGIDHALLEIGGELRGIGVRGDGLPWWVALEPVPDCAAPSVRIGLTGWAVATSGSWHRRRQAGGRSWSHTLDPRTGCPLDERVRAVSVLHRGCMQADALATAIMVQGLEEGLRFADRYHVPARIVTAGGAATSAAWRRWLA